MTREEVCKQLTENFRDVFDNDELVIQDRTTADDIEAWDSLNHVALVMEVQETWGFQIKPEQIVQLKNVGQFIDLILNQVNT